MPEKFVLLLVHPPIFISTGWAYKQLDLTINQKNFKLPVLFDKQRIFWELFENQFEAVVFPTYPEVGRVKEELLQQGALYAGLSGSGSTVFGAFQNIKAAKQAQANLFSYHTSITYPIF